MKRNMFVKKICAEIGNMRADSVVAGLLFNLAENGKCYTFTSNGRAAMIDRKKEILLILNRIGVEECKPSKKGNYFAPGYFIGNDAPKGGKGGEYIKINFSMF